MEGERIMRFRGRVAQVAVGVFAAGVVVASAAFCKPVEIKLTNVRGKVFYKNTEKDKWEKATDSLVIAEGAKVKTREESSCAMQFSGHSLIIRAGSVVSVDKADMTGKTEKTLIVVESGQVVADVDELTDDDSTFIVRVPGSDIVTSGIAADTKVVPHKKKVSPAPPK